MKLSAISVTLLVAILFVAAASFRPVKVSPVAAAIPDSVSVVFEKACIGCHSDDGNGMAKGKVNFDKWDTYSDQKKAEKAAGIMKAMNKGSMPPSGFRKNNPDKVPTEADLRLVTTWANSF